jgi:type II secretory pathway component PulF
MGSLFYVASDSSVATTDGQNIFGKYRVLKKTANFFSNQFTWMIVFFSIFVFAIIIRFLRNWLKKKQDYQIIKTKIMPP